VQGAGCRVQGAGLYPFPGWIPPSCRQTLVRPAPSLAHPLHMARSPAATQYQSIYFAHQSIYFHISPSICCPFFLATRPFTFVVLIANCGRETLVRPVPSPDHPRYLPRSPAATLYQSILHISPSILHTSPPILHISPSISPHVH